MPDIVLRGFHILNNLTLTTIQWDRCYPFCFYSQMSKMKLMMVCDLLNVIQLLSDESITCKEKLSFHFSLHNVYNFDNFACVIMREREGNLPQQRIIASHFILLQGKGVAQDTKLACHISKTEPKFKHQQPIHQQTWRTCQKDCLYSICQQQQRALSSLSSGAKHILIERLNCSE